MTGSKRAKRRRRGNIEKLANGSLRVRVYAGTDPVTKRPHYLRETVSAGSKAEQEAEKARTRLLNQVDERRNPRTNATVNQLLKRYLDTYFEGEPSTRDQYRGDVRKHIAPVAGQRSSGNPAGTDVRAVAGLSGKQLAEQAVADADVVAYCELTGASAEVADQPRQELREIRLEGASWDRRLRTGHRAEQEYNQQLQRSAACTRLFEIALVPGLVQTAEYARYVFDSAADLHPVRRDADEAVGARMARQDVLYDSGKEVEIRCSEAALRHPIAPARVMAAQPDRLLARSGGMSTTSLPFFRSMPRCRLFRCMAS